MYKVTAMPQNQTHYSPALDGYTTSGSKNWASDYSSFTQDVVVYDARGNNVFTDSMYFNTSAAVQYGKDHATTKPSVTTNTSTAPSGATNLGNVLYIGSSVNSIVITVGSSKWYARVTK